MVDQRAPDYVAAGYDFLRQIPTSDDKVYLQQAYNALVMNNRMLWLLLTTQQPIPTSKFAAIMKGDKIGATDQYVLLYENKSSNPVGVRVQASLGLPNGGPPGVQVKLSLSDDKADSMVVDYLGYTANGPSFNKRLSDTIPLKPNDRLYINTADTSFTLNAIDVFHVRVFDPGEILLGGAWEVR